MIKYQSHYLFLLIRTQVSLTIRTLSTPLPIVVAN